MRFLDGTALMNHYFIKLGFLAAWKAILEPDDRVRVFSRLEANLNDAAKARGELSLTVPMGCVEAERKP